MMLQTVDKLDKIEFVYSLRGLNKGLFLFKRLFMLTIDY